MARSRKAEEKPKGLRIFTPVLLAVHLLNPAPYNPNKQSPAKFEALKRTIREDGFVEPLVVQKKDYTIIGGHHRLAAIKEICVEDGIPVPELPCIVLDVDDAHARKLNLKLNHIKGAPDARLLGEMLSDMFPANDRQEDTFEAEINALGLEQEEALKYIRVVDPDAGGGGAEGEEVRTFGKSITLSLEFSSVKARDALKKFIQHQVEMEDKKSGDIVASALMPKKAKKPKAA